MRIIAPRGEPPDHVLAVPRDERLHYQELGVRLTRQPHDDVIGVHRLAAVLKDLLRNRPNVFPQVEHPRVLDVIEAQALRLNPEELLGIAEV